MPSLWWSPQITLNKRVYFVISLYFCILLALYHWFLTFQYFIIMVDFQISWGLLPGNTEVKTNKQYYRILRAAHPWKPMPWSSWYRVSVLMLMPGEVWNWAVIDQAERCWRLCTFSDPVLLTSATFVVLLQLFGHTLLLLYLQEVATVEGSAYSVWHKFSHWMHFLTQHSQGFMSIPGIELRMCLFEEGDYMYMCFNLYSWSNRTGSTGIHRLRGVTQHFCPYNVSF